MKTAALVSGGLDSSVLLRDLAAAGGRVLPLYVRTGLLWESAEIHWLERFLAAAEIEGCAPLKILDLPVADLYGDHWSLNGHETPAFEAPLDSNYLPGRNLLLLAKVAVLCSLYGIERIALAPLADNPFPDGTPEFFRAFSRTASLGLASRLRIDLPYRRWSKADVIAHGEGLPLQSTFSCIRPYGFEHCGDCTKCAERQHGFAAAGVPDPTRYHKPPHG